MGQRLGQHFLNDPSIIHRIVDHFAPKEGQTVIEIGPGQGAITFPLLEQVGTLHAIELDPLMIAHLEKVPTQGNLQIHAMDVLSCDFQQFTAPMRIIGNLPYYLTTPLIFQLLAQADRIQDMVFMVQEEVAARLCAAPNDSIYGRLSVMVQYTCEVEYLFEVPPSAFTPPPAVDSAVICLRPLRHRKLEAVDPAALSHLVAQAFAQRRKMLRKSLQTVFKPQDWDAMGIDGTLRPQSLSVEDFVRMSNFQKAQEI